MTTLAEIKAVLEKIDAKLAKQEKPSPISKGKSPKDIEKSIVAPANDLAKVWHAMGRPLDSLVDKFKRFTTIIDSLSKVMSITSTGMELLKGGAKAGVTGAVTGVTSTVTKGIYKQLSAEAMKDMAKKLGAEEVAGGYEHKAPISSVAEALKQFPIKGTTKTKLGSAIGLEGQPLDEAAAQASEAVAEMQKTFPVIGKNVTKIAPAIGKFGQPLGKAATEVAGLAGEEGAAEIAGTVAAGGEAAAGIAEAGAGAAEAGGLLAGLGGVGAALASNPIGWIVAAVAAVAAVAVELALLPFQLRDFGKSVVDSQKGLAEFSGSMAQVFAQREVFEAMQGQRMGEARAESTGRLETAYEGLSTALEPITNLLTNWFNTGLANLLEIVTVVIEIWNIMNGPMMAVLQYLIDKFSLVTNALEEGNRILRQIRGVDADKFEGEEMRNFVKNTIPMNWRRLPQMTAIPTG